MQNIRTLAVILLAVLVPVMSRAQTDVPPAGAPAAEVPAAASADDPAVATRPDAAPELPEGRETPFMKLWNPVRDAGIHGSASFDYFSSDKRLSNSNHYPGLNLTLKSAPQYGEHVKLYGEARIMAQNLNHSTVPNHFDARTQTLQDEVMLELREGYATLQFGDLELRVGKQIIVWGRADEINPTDWLSARNMTLLLPEPFDQRTGVFGVKADYYLPSDFRLTGVWQPIPTASVIPLPAVPGILFAPQLPDVKFSNGEYAAKIDHSSGGFDWSVSYFTGFNRLPEVSLLLPPGILSPTSPGYVGLSHHRIHGVGGDFVTVHGTWGFRGEAAYVHSKNGDGNRRDIQTPFVSYVAGIEKDFGESANLIIQYFGKYVFHRYDTSMGLPDDQFAQYNALFTGQLDTVQNGVSVRLDKKWWSDTLDLDLMGAVNFERTNWLIRPKLSYALTDEWKATVGGEVYGGKKVSQFGFLEDNTTAFAEMKWSF
ncbi:MAG: hypothetical protein KIT79_13515 [Deltaproteobacteria bacterium]|nr:hypothetical protein [Deltaproteobacteria bacterium]